MEYYSTFQEEADETNMVEIWESLVTNYMAKQNDRVIVDKDVENKFNKTVITYADELLRHFNEYGIEMIYQEKRYKILGRARLFRVAITEIINASTE